MALGRWCEGGREGGEGEEGGKEGGGREGEGGRERRGWRGREGEREGEREGGRVRGSKRQLGKHDHCWVWRAMNVSCLSRFIIVFVLIQHSSNIVDILQTLQAEETTMIRVSRCLHFRGY